LKEIDWFKQTKLNLKLGSSVISSAIFVNKCNICENNLHLLFTFGEWWEFEEGERGKGKGERERKI
jgi:hypothetical protein